LCPFRPFDLQSFSSSLSFVASVKGHDLLLWRKYKLDWSYAIGELFIVVAGVLIALAIDQWNTDRLERADEKTVVARLLDDLRLDVSSFDFRLDHVIQKEDSLLRVRQVLAKQRTEEPAQFLEDVISGADFGWNQGGANRATYNDLVGAGKVSIIRDSEIRLLISTYYEYIAGEKPRMDERETAYPGLSYQLVPRQRVEPATVDVLVEERILEQGLSEDALRSIVDDVVKSSIGRHVTAEINLARFILSITLDSKKRALELLEALEAYQRALE
jgi:hypothetical protein